MSQTVRFGTSVDYVAAAFFFFFFLSRESKKILLLKRLKNGTGWEEGEKDKKRRDGWGGGWGKTHTQTRKL